MNDRQVIDRQRAEEFARTAATPDEKALADINEALHAMPQALAEKRAELEQAGYRDEKIADELVAFRTSLIKQARLLQDRAEALRGSYKDDFFEIERGDDHREASQWFESLDIDKRNEALHRAGSGEDDLLAEALLTGRHSINEIDLERIRARVWPDDMIEQNKRNATMRTHTNRTMASVERMIRQLTGA